VLARVQARRRCIESLPSSPCQQSPIDLHQKNNNQRASPRAPGRGDRLGSGASSSARPAPLARARRTSGVQRQIGPLLFRPKFELVKKKYRGRACTRRTYKKRRDILLCPFRVAVALSCVSGVIYLCRNTFFVGFSAATACYHCVHIASFLHDFDRFSYSLSTTSC
jgi:hypothetical protein